ncbi:hypothetical protein FPOA_02227 [Fusarium poae]|uniref:HNH nuclease domain-containing protein n=1 Tax=Fusarium poae TaxID=36050 RepID=A0A1B8B6F0_FUSPO|nr:hypothetical protein FPOA_02227 [Fusarium poae]
MHSDFSDPNPLFSFTDLRTQRKYAQQIEKHIQTLFRNFRLRTKHIAAILLIDNIQHIEPGGALAPMLGCWFKNQGSLKGKLNCIDAFVKHYMLYLNPDNINGPAWAHSVPETLDIRPDSTADEEGLAAFVRALDYDSQFRTDNDLEDYPLGVYEEVKCRKRDEDVCVVTGNNNPKIFWFFPPTLNDTKIHNDMTGNLAGSGDFVTGVNLRADREPDPFCNMHQLGGSHKAWNMLCIDPALYNPLTSGLCAFKHFEDTTLENGNVEVTLQFHWMPRTKGRFGKAFDMESDWQNLMDELQVSQDNNYPPPLSFQDEPITKSGEPLRSGHLIHVIVPEQDVQYLKSAVKVHWACSMFTSLCGASGRPYLLSGKEYDDPAMQCYQDQGRQGQQGDKSSTFEFA